MEKRKLISLRAVLLGYLGELHCGSGALAPAVFFVHRQRMASSGQPGGAGLERGSTEHPAVPDGENI